MSRHLQDRREVQASRTETSLVIGVKLDDFVLGRSALRSGFAWWTEANPTPLVQGAALALASYANASTFKPGSGEGLPVMGAVLGAAVAGVGARTRGPPSLKSFTFLSLLRDALCMKSREAKSDSIALV